MPTHPMNLALLALIVGMVIYHGRLYLLYSMAFRLGFLTFWFLLGLELISQERRLLIPAIAALIYGIWKRRRIGKDVDRLLEGDNQGPQAFL